MSNVLEKDFTQTLQTAAPLYSQVADKLRSSIQSGQLQPGQQIPTEAEMIDRYNVSRITIRRALQELTSEKLILGTRGKGTFVNPSIFTGIHTYLFIHGLDYGLNYPFTNLIFQGISQKNDDKVRFRLEMLGLSPVHLQNESDRRVEDLLSSTPIQGIICFPRLRNQILERIIDRDVPIVQIGIPTPPPPPGVLSIATHGMDSWKLLLDYLIQSGRKRIGLIEEPAGSNPTPNEPNIRKMFKSRRLKNDLSLFEPAQWGINGGQRAAEQLLERHPDLDTIMASDDMQALGAIRAVEKSGRSVGKDGDVAVTGMGNILGEHSHCQLTTVDFRLEELGGAAARYLRELIDGTHSSENTVQWQGKLLVRQTA